jgi:two-component system, cell cycle sensor histidine kinase and response regulator CckA
VALSRNGRLQGPDSDPGRHRRHAAVVAEGQPFSGEVLNYRKDGTLFWNDLSIVRDEEAAYHFVRVQADISQRRLKDAPLSCGGGLLSPGG